MKRLFKSSDSLSGLISLSSSKVYSEKKNKKTNQGYNMELQAMLDRLEEEDYIEEACYQSMEKKRRLSVDQVKALEKHFDIDNKLEPKRKLQLAKELRLQPRQVAIWFQNRRARWKTKQLERDYKTLMHSYDALKLECNSLEQENEALALKVEELKAKTREQNAESDIRSVVKTEYSVSVSEHNMNGNTKDQTTNISSSSSSLMSLTHFSESRRRTSVVNGVGSQELYQTRTVKVEDQYQNCFSSDEPYNFFLVDQAPTLHWYSSLTSENTCDDY